MAIQTAQHSPVDAATNLPMVRLEHVHKTYPGSHSPAVDDLSLEVREGEIFTLLGPSGCGKTTTLRMVAGLETADQATIFFKDKLVVDTDRHLFVPPNKRNVGMVFQSYAIWPHMTVEENVAYPLKLRRVPRQEIRERVQKALDLVGLSGFGKRPAPLLSGGQQQRVALARALVYAPSVLLLDEPFSNLDSKLREQMRVEVKLLQTRLKVTVLFVTHDQTEALTLSDRIGVMDRGRLLQVGSPRELYERPSDSFVRDFLGKTLLLKAIVRSSHAGEVVAEVAGANDCVVDAECYGADQLTPGAGVWVALRPEDAELCAAGQSGSLNGTIEAVLFAGDRTEFQVAIAGQTSLTVYGSRRERFEAGQHVGLRVRSDAVSIWPQPGA
jgi:ABC-type Fe3+/spermidine/putrescine transport system ATPase subunit